MVPARITISRWGGRGGRDLTPHGGLREGLLMWFFPQNFPSLEGNLSNLVLP